MNDIIRESEYLMNKAIDLANEIRSIDNIDDCTIIKSLNERSKKLAYGYASLNTELNKLSE